jgi:hypothetical protein
MDRLAGLADEIADTLEMAALHGGAWADRRLQLASWERHVATITRSNAALWRRGHNHDELEHLPSPPAIAEIQ